MVLNRKRDDLNQILGGHFFLRGWLGTGTAAQRNRGCPIPGGSQGHGGGGVRRDELSELVGGNQPTAGAGTG